MLFPIFCLGNTNTQTHTLCVVIVVVIQMEPNRRANTWEHVSLRLNIIRPAVIIFFVVVLCLFATHHHVYDFL